MERTKIVNICKSTEEQRYQRQRGCGEITHIIRSVWLHRNNGKTVDTVRYTRQKVLSLCLEKNKYLSRKQKPGSDQKEGGYGGSRLELPFFGRSIYLNEDM